MSLIEADRVVIGQALHHDLGLAVHETKRCSIERVDLMVVF